MLFETKKGYYVYDVYNNSLIKVSEDFFRSLQNVEETRVDKKEFIERYCEENKIRNITISAPKESIVNPFSEYYIESVLKNNLSMLVLSLTDKCNLNCIYCCYHYKFQITQKSMPWEIAKKAIDVFLANSRLRNKIHIGFYGGEALLEFELLKKCVSYIKQNVCGTEVTFGITTNGTLLNSTEIKSFLQDNDFDVLLSLDGPARINDRYRISKAGNPTHSIVINNLKQWYLEEPDYVTKRISINAVLAPTNSKKLLDDYLMNFPVRVEITPLEKTEYFNQSIDNTMLSALKSISKEEYQYSEKFENAQIEEYKYIYQVSKNAKMSNVHKPYIPGGACIPGKIRIYVNSAGNIYPCEKVKETEENRIGNVDKGLDYKKIYTIFNDFVSKVDAGCGCCWVRKICKFCYKDIDNIDCDRQQESIRKKFIYYIENCYMNDPNIQKILMRIVE